MALLTLKVELDGIENDDLDGMKDRVYEALEKLSGTNVLSVLEEGREEDEDEEGED